MTEIEEWKARAEMYAGLYEIHKTRAAELVALEIENARLAARLATALCPYPIGDDVTVAQCVAAGKCGCDQSPLAA